MSIDIKKVSNFFAKYFKLFNHQRGLTGTDIYTYKIDWEGKNATIVESYLKKQVKEESMIENVTLIKNNTNVTNTNS